MKSEKIRRMVLAAVLTALITVATAFLSMPLPTGYVHLGDGLVLLAGWMLGPIWGAAAAGLGSALADLLLGYVTYAPGTFAVKAVTAAVCVLIVRLLARMMKNRTVPLLCGGIAAELVMVGGYFAYEALVLGVGGAAAASLPGNLMQGLVGLIVFVLLAALFGRYRIADWMGREK